MKDFFSWERLWANLPKLISKLPITFEIVGFSFVLGGVLAMLLACVCIKRIPVLHQLTGIFISFERGTPLLVQMLVVYYALPLMLEGAFGISTRGWGKILFVDIALILNEGAFLSETFRASILSIPAGQREAALASGLSEGTAFFRIVLPQAIRTALPATGINLIGLFQDSSLVFMIGVIDIVGRAQAIGTATNHSLEAYIIVGITFVSISLLLGLLSHHINRRFTYRSREAA